MFLEKLLLNYAIIQANSAVTAMKLSAVILGCFWLAGCGGSTPENSAPLEPEPTITPLTFSNWKVTNLTPNSVTISIASSTSVDVGLTVAPIAADEIQPTIASSATDGTEHTMHLTQLWADTRYQVSVTAANQVKTYSFKTPPPVWSQVCRKGQLKLPVMADGPWSTYTDVNGSVTVRSALGCQGSGSAAEFDFNLNDGQWVVASRTTPFDTPIDLSAYTHLWIPYKGQAEVSVAFEVKLVDSNGSLSVVRLDGGAALPVWRSWAVDLREFKPQLGELDLRRISSIEVAFSKPKSQFGARQGKLTLADMQAWHIDHNLPDESANQVAALEPVLPNSQQLSAIALDLLSRQAEHGFIPAWYELSPNWHLYANAMALIVFTLEYERLSKMDDPHADNFLNAANTLTDALVDLQGLSNRQGAWDDSFRVSNNRLVLKPGSQRDFWVGSTAWAGLSLILASDILPNGQRLNENISAVSQYYLNHQQCREQAGLPRGSITEGTEGNISTHLFLMAAQKRGLAQQQGTDLLGDFIANELFDSQQNRFFCGVSVDLGTGLDQQSCATTGSGQIVYRDATACLDVLANWGTQWLVQHGRDEDAMRGLHIGRDMFATQDFAATGIKGLGDIAGPWSPTVEHGAGQYAVQGGPDANYIMNQAAQHLCSQGQCQGAADNFSAGIGWNTTANGISPAAWMYLAWHGGFWSKL